MMPTTTLLVVVYENLEMLAIGHTIKKKILAGPKAPLTLVEPIYCKSDPP